MWNDPLKLNLTPRNIEVKVFLSKDYRMFGSTCEKHKKYLPCYAIVLLTKKGIVHSCGYANGMELK